MQDNRPLDGHVDVHGEHRVVVVAGSLCEIIRHTGFVN
jgi:hypothetical protein